MTSASNGFVLNIVELQNVVNSVSGVDPVGYLSNQVSLLQQMVNYDSRQINVNVISNFDQSPIQVVAPINFSNVALTINDGAVTGATTGGGGVGTVSSIGTGSNGIFTVGGASADPGLLFTQNGASTMYITSAGNTVFTGSVSATNFITTSDFRWKTDIHPISDHARILSSVRGVRFRWSDGRGKDIGVIAQDLEPVLPEAVVEGPDGLQVAYMKLIPVLVESIKSLEARVAELEALVRAPKALTIAV